MLDGLVHGGRAGHLSGECRRPGNALFPGLPFGGGGSVVSHDIGNDVARHRKQSLGGCPKPGWSSLLSSSRVDPKPQVARDYGVSKGWVSKLVARYRAEGDSAFEPRSRRPAHPARRHPGQQPSS